MKKIVAFLLLLPLSVYAQIQITQSDISAIFAVGYNVPQKLDKNLRWKNLKLT